MCTQQLWGAAVHLCPGDAVRLGQRVGGKWGDGAGVVDLFGGEGRQDSPARSLHTGYGILFHGSPRGDSHHKAGTGWNCHLSSQEPSKCCPGLVIARPSPKTLGKLE